MISAETLLDELMELESTSARLDSIDEFRRQFEPVWLDINDASAKETLRAISMDRIMVKFENGDVLRYMEKWPPLIVTHFFVLPDKNQ